MANCIPCPFCGWRNVRPESDRGRVRTAYSITCEWFVSCPNCGARGPVVCQNHRSDGTCKNEAIKLWNRWAR